MDDRLTLAEAQELGLQISKHPTKEGQYAVVFESDIQSTEKVADYVEKHKTELQYGSERGHASWVLIPLTE